MCPRRADGEAGHVMNSMDTARSATPPVPVAGKDADRQHGKLAEKVMVRNLNFYYGDHRALKTVNGRSTTAR